MAIDKKATFEKAIKAAKKPNVYFVGDVIAMLPISRPTFYKLFPPESEELEQINEALEVNKVNTKLVLRYKLMLGEKSGELIALYKLIGTDAERKALSQTFQTLDGELKTPHTVELTDKQFKEALKAITPK